MGARSSLAGILYYCFRTFFFQECTQQEEGLAAAAAARTTARRRLPTACTSLSLTSSNASFRADGSTLRRFLASRPHPSASAYNGGRFGKGNFGCGNIRRVRGGPPPGAVAGYRPFQSIPVLRARQAAGAASGASPIPEWSPSTLCRRRRGAASSLAQLGRRAHGASICTTVDLRRNATR